MAENLPPISRFVVDGDKCTGCGLCAADCPARILRVEGGVPRVVPDKDEYCIGCQHCLAICPVAAVGVRGLDPADSLPLPPVYNAAGIELLMRGRRSIRSFASGTVDPRLITELVNIAANAPTGVNMRRRRFTVVQDPAVLAEFRDRSARLVVGNGGRFPGYFAWIEAAAKRWVEKGVDLMFRNAPHLLVTSAAPEAVCGEIDSLIAMAYFDLYAQARGVGTVWCGVAEQILRYYPETRAWLGIPDEHALGYAMLFGPAGVAYARAAQYRSEETVIVDALHGEPDLR